MAEFRHAGSTIHFDLEGPDDAMPVLLIAPGGMRSFNDRWSATPWNPRVALADAYRLIGMDQRNAGRSTAPVSGSDGWATYRDDQLALLDHLGIVGGVSRCHVVGMCIGGPYIVGLLTAAPDRFASAVLLQPVGIDGNRAVFDDLFDGWQAELAPAHPEATDADWASFKSNMWDGEFVLTATREQVAAITTPLLIAMGDDEFHPQSTSRELAALAADVTFLERWKDDQSLPATDAAIRSFLAAHTPA
jgi:pimeloyl-ACP methyl ester carboxylesterase